MSTLEKLLILAGSVLGLGTFFWLKVRSFGGLNREQLDRAIENIRKERERARTEADAALADLDDSLEHLNKLRRERGEREITGED